MKARRFDFVGATSAGLLVVFGLAVPAAAQESGVVPVLAMSPGRIGAIVAVLAGVVGLTMGGRALRAASRVGRSAGRSGAVGALAAGSTGMALGGLVVATAGGGLGTGHGLGGGAVAVVLGLLSVIVGGLARAKTGLKW